MSTTSVRRTSTVTPDTAYAMWVSGELHDFVQAPDDSKVEVIGGEVVVSPAPVLKHDGIIFRVSDAFGRARYSDDTFPWSTIGTGLDLVGVGDGYIPDLLVLESETLDAALQSEARHLVPDQIELVVEVTSPSNARRDRKPGPKRVKATKWNGYARAEIPYYLLIDRDPKIACCTLYSIPDQASGAYLHHESWDFGETIPLPEPFDIEIPTATWSPWE